MAIDVPLGTFPDGVVRPGNYEFPFSATLPAGLPTAMAARGDGGDCRVTYTLKARLHKPSWYKWDTTATRSIMVQSAPLPPSPVPYFAPPTSVLVACCPAAPCICGDYGLIHMGAGVDDTLLGRGQSVGVGIAVQTSRASRSRMWGARSRSTCAGGRRATATAATVSSR